MKKLFKVQTRRYHTHYVVAESFNEAAEMVKKIIEQEHEDKGIIDEDGGIRKPLQEEEITISNVEFLTDKLVN